MLPNRYRPIYRFALFLNDLIAVNAAFYLSYLLWMVFNKGASLTPNPMYLQLWFFVNVLWIPYFHQAGMYREDSPADFSRQVRTVAAGTTVGIMLLTFIIFFIRFLPTPEVFYSRAVFFSLWFLSIVLLTGGRGLIHSGILVLKGRGRLQVYTIIMGSPSEAEKVAASLNEAKRRDFKILGAVGSPDAAAPEQIPVLGHSDDIARIVKEYNIEVVIVADPDLTPSETLKIVDSCREIGVAIHILQDYLGVLKTQTSITDIANVPTVTIRDIQIRGFNRALKRAVDATLAFTILAILSPFLSLVSVLIKLDSPGPVFFRQSRVGRNGKHFSILKFRSMHKDAEKEKAELEPVGRVNDHLFKIESDPRITRVGGFIRRWSIDELPQLFNVLFGEMSLVGPRPLPPEEAPGYEPWHERRLKITPGITGLWQVSGRNELNFEDMVKLDIYYIENWSLWLDFEILLRTFPAVISRRGAY